MPKIVISNLGAVGVIKDLPPHRLAPNAFTHVRNAHFKQAGAKSGEYLGQVMTPVSGGYPAGMTQLCWLMQFPPLVQPIWVYASIGSSKLMGTLQKSAGVWTKTNITRVTDGAVYNNVAEQRWQGGVFQGLGIFNQERDQPQLWAPMATGTALVNLTNWGTNPEGTTLRARALRPYKNFLIAMYLSNSGSVYPYRVRWSSPAPPGQVPTSWAVADPANDSGEGDLAETTDYIVDGLTLGEIFIIYKERSTWGLQYIGGKEKMRTWRIFSEIGLLGKDCAVQFPGGHFAATQDDLIVHSGTPGSEKSVVQNKMRSWYNRQLNLTYAYNAYAIAYPHDQEIWYCYPTTGSIFANQAIVYHWDTGVCGIQDLPYAVFGANGSVSSLSTTDVWG
jgi:hypothetical protein